MLDGVPRLVPLLSAFSKTSAYVSLREQGSVHAVIYDSTVPVPVSTAPASVSGKLDLQDRLVALLRERALVVGDVTLSSGVEAKYYVDAKRATLTREGFDLVGQLVATAAKRLGATAVGGLTMGADPIACAALAADGSLKAFFVRKKRKEHGLQRWIEGPALTASDRCLIVDDVVTSGRSTIDAIKRIDEEDLTIVGVVSIVDRLAGGTEAIKGAVDVPYIALTTIDDVYPDRPDR